MGSASERHIGAATGLGLMHWAYMQCQDACDAPEPSPVYLMAGGFGAAVGGVVGCLCAQVGIRARRGGRSSLDCRKELLVGSFRQSEGALWPRNEATCCRELWTCWC
jgi:hypothetical protein